MNKIQNTQRRFMSHQHVLFAMLLAMLFALPVRAVTNQEICVASDNEQRKDAACITLHQLPEWIRKNVNRDSQGQALNNVVVRLGEGVHRLNSPIIIDSSAWRNGDRKLTIEGMGTSKTIVSGAVPVTTYPVSESVRASKKLPPGVVRISLKSIGIIPPAQLNEYRFGKSAVPDFELFSNGKRLPRSRWPNSGFDTVATVEELGGLRFTVRGQDVSRYAAESALMLGGYFAHDWADEILRSGPIDKSGVRFAQSAPTYGVKIGQRIWFENALSDIDVPGEWAYDTNSQFIYLLPDNLESQAIIEVSSALEGIVFDKVWNVLVKDIGFTSFRDNAIRVVQGLDITIKGVSIRNSGGVGIRLNGRNIVADELHISDTGAGGASISGGNRIDLSPGRVAIRNCTVERVGRLSKSYKTAIGIAGVGNEVSNCRLSDGPHSAILFHGNDHLIEGNLIERFVLETDDAGAIYTGQDWTARGTIIRGNLLRSLGGMSKTKYGVKAIYLDDQASGIIVEDNLIINSQRGVLVGGGRDNKITGNIFYGCSDGVYIDSRGTVDIRLRGDMANPGLRKKFTNVNAAGPVYSDRYPELLASGIHALGNAGNNLANDNIFAACTSPYVVKSPGQSGMLIGATHILKPEDAQVNSNSLLPSDIPLIRQEFIDKSVNVSPIESIRNIP